MDIPRKDLVRKRRICRIVYSAVAAAATGVITFGLSRLDPAAPTVADIEARTGKALMLMIIRLFKDLDVEAGIKHLQKYGHFDEIMTGRGWLNIRLLKYVHEGFPGKAATPQILVVDRRKVRTAGSAIQDEILVLRKVGADEIAAWASLGTPLPTPQAGQAGRPLNKTDCHQRILLTQATGEPI